MAIVNKSARQGEFVPRGAEPGLTKRFAWRDANQDKAIQDIAGLRFNFPSPEHPFLRTHVNRPERSLGVRLPDGELVFPDIVAVDRDAAVALIGEVESPRTMRELEDAALIEKWTTFSGLGDLLLFVPMVAVPRAQQLVKHNRIRLAGLRSWRYIAGQDLLDIVDV